MKQLFAIIVIVLVSGWIAIHATFPDTRSAVPVIYWVTDNNPAREDQVRIFHEWLVKNGHVTEDGKPACELRLDHSNNDNTKKLIQGVSGVGSDVFDMWNGQTVHYFQDVGILDDVTEPGRELGFDTSHTYPAIESELTVRGHQYAFPCNVTVGMYWSNRATFERYGVEPPPVRWTVEDFERIGKQLVDNANIPGERRTVFMVNNMNILNIYRSQGLSVFNETMTRCTIDDPRYIAALRLKHKWMYEDHLLPSLAEQQSFDTAAGYGGPTLQLFNRGNYAMIQMGRYALIQLRKFGEMDLGVSEPLHQPGGMPNCAIGTRCAGVYVASKHKEFAHLFLAYLASDDYNMQIVRDADALPPNPASAKSEAFLRPPDHPSEWGLHEIFLDAAMNIAIPAVNSPFILTGVYNRHLTQAEDAFMNDRKTAEEAAAQAAERINAEIDRTVAEQPRLREEYQRRLERQKKIDEYRAAGKPVPVEWIDSPFHRRWYAYNGWLAEPAKQGDAD